jgi:hypothetical protein
MGTQSTLRDERTDCEALRAELDRRERTVLDLRLVRKTLHERVVGEFRGSERARADSALTEHLDRLLRRHATDDRPLDYLGEAVADVDLARYARGHFEASIRPDLRMDGPPSGDDDAPATLPDDPGDLADPGVDAGVDHGLDPARFAAERERGFDADVDFETLLDGPFPRALTDFLATAAAGGDTDGPATTLAAAYDDLLAQGTPDERVRAMAVVGGLVEVARLAVVGTHDDEVLGVRTELNDRLGEHVATLETTDGRLTDANEPDPLVALDWHDPVATLPVRLETRFVDGGDTLAVRIYPEPLHVDTHEDQLTPAERDWGRRYWTRLWVAGVPDVAPLHTVDGDTASLSGFGHDGGDLVVPPTLTDADGRYLAPTQVGAPDAREAALELLRAFAAGEFSADPAARYEEVRERAWAAGVERFDAERAAFVLQEMAPEGRTGGRSIADALRAGYDDDGTPPLADAVSLDFPDPDLRPASWTKTPRASLLPDRFVVTGTYAVDDDQATHTDWQDHGDYLERRAGDVWERRVTGGAVTEPLAVGPSPEAVAAESGDATSEMSWMTDFSAAEAAGMVVTMPVPDRADWSDSDGFERLVVTGTKTSMGAAESQAALQDLLEATEHTDGLELLSPGTPTNNADDSSTRDDGHDPGRNRAVATGPSVVEPGTDGGVLADALGVPHETFAHVPGAGDTRDRDARAANRVLWPATVGYFARNLAVPGGSGGTAGADGGDGEREDEDGDGEGDGAPTAAQLLGTGPSDTGEGPPTLLRWLETTRRHFVEFVRSGGPFTTLRAGDQPYGVLPVAPLDVAPEERFPGGVDAEPQRDASETDHRPSTKYATAPSLSAATQGYQPGYVPSVDETRFLPELVERVLALGDDWLDFAENVPSVADDATLSDDALLDLFGQEATAFTYRRQLWLLGQDNPLYRNTNLDADATDVRQQVRDDLQQAGLPAFGPRIADLLFLGASMQADDVPVTDGDVGVFLDTVLDLFSATASQTAFSVTTLRALEDDPEDGSITFDAHGDVDQPRDAFFDAVDPTGDAADYDPDTSLLRQLALFAALHAAVASRVRLGATYGWATGEYAEFPAEPTAYGPGDTTVFELFTDDLPTGQPVTGGGPLTDHPGLDTDSDFRDVLGVTADSLDGATPPPDPALYDFLASLSHLSTVDPERIDRLTRETLDLASHRLDAWWTSIATRRLGELRTSRPTGVHVAAYGFVEDLAPGSGPDAEYLLAPSLDQATTGAVLRSAHAARDGADDPNRDGDQSAPGRALAVDCSPDQVQRARPLLRGVRRGHDLGELLGYRFERGLRDYSDAHGLSLEAYLDVFRDVAPSVEGKLARGNVEAATRQSDVADGMRLYRLWKAGDLEPELRSALARDPGGNDQTALSDLRSALGGLSLAQSTGTGVFPAIHAAMEAVHDVLLTEGVHHLVHGRPERATAALDALSRGTAPPEPTALDTPRSETGVTHRLLVAFGDAADPKPRKPWRPSNRAVLQPGDFGASTGRIDLGDVGDLGGRFLGRDVLRRVDPSVFAGQVETVDVAEGQFDAVNDIGGQFEGGSNTGGNTGGAGVGDVVDVDAADGVDVVDDQADGRSLADRVGADQPRIDRDALSADGLAGTDEDDEDDEDDGGPEADGGTPVDTVQVRHRGEPALDTWVGGLLPDPDAVGCTGEFQWERERGFAVGEFETPASPGTVTVDDVGFEPDVVQFTVVPAAPADGASETGAGGVGTGVFRRAVDADHPETQTATAAAVDDAGTVHHDARSDRAVLATFAAEAARGGPASVGGRVGDTTADGFEVAFDTVATPPDGPERVAVQYRAFRLADPTRVRVRTASLPNSASSASVTVDFGSDDFAPDHLTASACLPVSSHGPGTTTGAIGVAQGEVVRDDDGTVHQQATGVGFDPATDGAHATATDAGLLAVETGAGDGLAVTASGLGEGDPTTVDLDATAPAGGTYAGAALVTVVGVESPRTDTPAGATVHRPAIGTVAAPTADADANEVTVDAGFEPGLVELRLAPGVTGTGADALPVAGAVDAETVALSLGSATSTVSQRSLATAATAAGCRASRTVADVAGTPRAGSDGVADGVGVTVTGFADAGFTLSFDGLPESGRPLVQYRAWPAAPDSEAFAVPIEGATANDPDGVSLDDLDLTPLDAVAVTSGVTSPGDSQLARRVAYHAFRHRPASRPPVPDDATLDVRFDDPGPDHDVSVAEYVEVARSVADLLGQGRPADATDFAHPNEAGAPGHLDASDYPPGTAGILANRAGGIADDLRDLQTMLRDRHDLLAPDPNVCDAVAGVERATRHFRREAPVSQTVDVADDLATTHPGPGHGTVTDTVLEELAAVADAVPAGPTDDDADHVVANASKQALAGIVDVEQAVDVTVTVRSHADATRFQTKLDDDVTTSEMGEFDTAFDFSGVPAGTAFTVVVEPRNAGGSREALETAAVEAVEDLDPPGRYALLVLLAAEGRFSPPSWLGSVRAFQRLVRDVRDELDPDGNREERLERRRDLFSDIHDHVRDRGLPGSLAHVDPEEWLRPVADLAREALVHLLGVLEREAAARRFRRANAGGSGVLYAGRGRVVHDDPGTAPDLASAIADATYLPSLLWLYRVLPAFDPGGDGPASDLQAAVSDAPFGVVRDERDAMRTMLRVLGHRRPDPRVFERADVDAVADLLALDTLDLAGLFDALRAVCRPLAWTGLASAVDLTGDPARPDAQSVWAASDPDVDAVVPKDGRGEVRARLERLREHPETDAPRQFAAYSPPIRALVADGRMAADHVGRMELFVADPVALLDTFGDLDPSLPALLADVHDVLHHVDATDPSTVGGLARRLDAFVGAVDAANRREELERFVDEPGDLVDAVRDVDDRLARAVDDHRSAATPYADAVADFTRDYADALATLDATATAELDGTVLPVTQRSDVAGSFRSGVLETVRHLLVRTAYFGVYGSVPAAAAGGSADDESTLVTQVARVLDEVDARLVDADALAPSQGDAPTVDGQIERLQALLGDGFVVCPPFAPTNPTELHRTLADDQLVDDRYEPDTWLQRVARVRDLPKDYRRVRRYADALDVATGHTGTLRRGLDVGQLPHVPGQDWLGRDGVTPNGGELSLALEFATRASNTSPVASAPGSGPQAPPLAGFLVDEWVERTPASEETVGLGLRYDDPSARAPQSVLLAVPPTWERGGGDLAAATAEGVADAGPSTWTDALLDRTVDETLDQVRARSVDLDAFDRYGHLLPMLCFAYNRETLLDREDGLRDAPSVDLNEFDWTGGLFR